MWWAGHPRFWMFPLSRVWVGTVSMTTGGWAVGRAGGRAEKKTSEAADHRSALPSYRQHQISVAASLPDYPPVHSEHDSHTKPQTDLFGNPAGDPRELVILDQRLRGCEFVEHDVKTIANSPENTGMGFWSINPYVGCEFGCTYCYARNTHQYVVERAHNAGRIPDDTLTSFRTSHNWESFEHQIFVKQRNAVLAALNRDLVRIHQKNSPQNRQSIVIGTATDPYQPAERRFQITRSILERFTTTQGLALSIITKSPLICRDIDVLRELERHHHVTVFISLISTDEKLIRLFEARSPVPHARLRALRKLRNANVNAGIIAAPVLPGITDSAFRIDALIAAAKEAGAAFVQPAVLRIYRCTWNGLLPILDEHFPDLVPRYRALYRDRRNASRGYLDAVKRRFRRITRKHGLASMKPMQDSGTARRPEIEKQLSLL